MQTKNVKYEETAQAITIPYSGAIEKEVPMTYAQYFKEKANSLILMSKEQKDKDTEKDESEKPKGFEKFLKKSKKGSSSKLDKEAKKDKKEKDPKKDDEESDVEEETDGKKEEKEEKSSSFMNKRAINDFFFNPNGGPKYENYAIIAALLGGMGYYLYNKE